jgi:cholesterol transport system auxiliary component
MKYLFILVITIFLSGCSFKKPLEINTYALNLKTQQASHTKKKANTDATLLLHFPRVNPSFNTQEMIYSTQAHLFEKYAKNRWLQLPSNMLFSLLQEEFEHNKLFKHVTHQSQLQHDYALSTQLLSLYHAYEKNQSYAIVRMKFDFIHQQNIVKTFYFEQKVLSKENTPYGFVVASNEAVQITLKMLLENLLELIEQ